MRPSSGGRIRGRREERQDQAGSIFEQRGSASLASPVPLASDDSFAGSVEMTRTRERSRRRSGITAENTRIIPKRPVHSTLLAFATSSLPPFGCVRLPPPLASASSADRALLDNSYRLAACILDEGTKGPSTSRRLESCSQFLVSLKGRSIPYWVVRRADTVRRRQAILALPLDTDADDALLKLVGL